MSENNNTNQPNLAIKSFKIESNHDNEETYSVAIETSAHTIMYPRVIVTFGASQVIAFPVGFQVVDDDNNVLFTYSLNLQQKQPEESQQTNN